MTIYTMESPLTIHHRELGATLSPEHLPLTYGDTDGEYWALRKAAGITDLSHTGRLIMTGRDKIAFLNGLITNDLSQLKTRRGVHSALLNTKARVLADFYVYDLDESLLVETGDSHASRVKNLLDQFIITEDVHIEDVSRELLQCTLQGPKVEPAIRQILGLDVHELAQLSFEQLGPSTIIARSRTEAQGYDILLPRDEAEAVWQSFLLKGADLGVRPVGLNALDICRLEKGLPKYGVDVDENTIVLEAGYRDAISFTKGCYMGQEVVARATHIGRVNRHLVQLDVEGSAPPGHGAELTHDGKGVGHVTSAAFSPAREKTVGLGYVNRDFAVKGSSLTVGVGTGIAVATVLGIV